MCETRLIPAQGHCQDTAAAFWRGSKTVKALGSGLSIPSLSGRKALKSQIPLARHGAHPDSLSSGQVVFSPREMGKAPS